ncbi:MAG: DUF1246 domain-containing protein [bacterium]
MVIEREEMREIVKTYREPIGLNLGSHSALDAWKGQRDHGTRSIIYVTPQRARIYLQNPMVGKPDEEVEDLPKLVKRDLKVVNDPKDIKKKGAWRSVLLILDKYSDIVRYVDDLVDLECLQIPNRAFAVYVGGDEYCSVIEKEFAVPIVGSRKLLKIENRGEIEKDYYWFAEQAGIPCPSSYKYEVYKRGIKFKEPIDEPILLKAEHAHREFEREFIFAADSEDLEEKVDRDLKLVHLSTDKKTYAKKEEILLSVRVFNRYYRPSEHGRVYVELVDPSGKRIDLGSALPRDRPGEHGSSYLAEEEGKYTFAATAWEGSKLLGTDTVSCKVAIPSLEWENAQLNEPLLKELSDLTKGRYFHISSVESEEIILPEIKETTPVVKKVVAVWNNPSIFILLCVLLGIEWYIRRRRGMM